MDIDLSVVIRVVLILVCAGVLVYRNAGFIKEAKKHKAKKQAKMDRQGQLAERREARKQQLVEAKRKHEQAKKQTAELLVRSLEEGLQAKVATVGGYQIHYVEGGEVGRPRVLLLHGFAADKEVWAPVTARLAAEGFHVVAPDLPGFGQNVKTTKLQYDVMSQTKRIRAFAKEIGFSPCHVAGSSVGAMVAGAYAYGAAAEILSLALVEPLGLRVPYESELAKWLSQDRNPLLIVNPAAYENLLGFLCTTPPQIDEAVQAYRAEGLAKSRELHQRIWTESLRGERANLLDQMLPEITQKTLVLGGAESKVVHPKTPEVAVSVMRDARAVSVAGAGHLVMLEKPDEVTAYLMSFFASIGA